MRKERANPSSRGSLHSCLHEDETISPVTRVELVYQIIFPRVRNRGFAGMFLEDNGTYMNTIV